MKVDVIGEVFTEEEKQAYARYVKSTHPNERITRIVLKPEGDYVDIDMFDDPPPFERIRRITGYLVGTLDRFNDAKLAEEADRVKHDVSEPEQEDIPVQEM